MMQRFGPVSGGVDEDLFIGMGGSVRGCELGGDDHLISVTALFHPFSDPLLRLRKLAAESVRRKQVREPKRGICESRTQCRDAYLFILVVVRGYRALVYVLSNISEVELNVLSTKFPPFS
jgi:hypothetical protein